MTPTILRLNPIQRFRLYQFLETQGSGGSYLRRVKRIYEAMAIEAIEAVFEKNQETIDALQRDGRPVRKDTLTAFRHDDPADEIDLESGDFDWIWRRTRVWEKAGDPDEGKNIDPCKACGQTRQRMDWRVYLPILDELERVYVARKNGESIETRPADQGG